MQETTTPLISVIVPAYNLEKLLARCLQSIQAQTYENWECLVVNDGSADGTSQVCDVWAQKDSRFKAIHKQNGGVSSARNVGMEAAKGQYFLFVDGDDALEPFAMDWAINWQRKAPEDMISWGLRGPEDTAVNERDWGESRLFNAQQVHVYGAIGASTNVTIKLFHADIIAEKALCYDTSLARGEDGAFCWAYLCAFFELRPKACVHQYEEPLYIVYSDNGPSRASEQAVKAHTIVWDRALGKGYSKKIMQEYTAMLASIGGFEALQPKEKVSISLQYLRRFAFAVWAADQLKEALPENFWGQEGVGELIANMKHNRIYNAYYWPFALKWRWLVCKMYQSDESESKKLYWRVFKLGDILLGGKWQRM